MTHFGLEYSGADPVSGSSTPLNRNKFDALASARFHRLRFSMTGDFEIVGIAPDLVADGEE